MATPHITAEPGQIAPLVIMPGDPKRAEMIAKNYFTDVHCVSDVRAIQTWVGRFEGEPVTAMASGMGIPSLSIYATELFRFYDVQRICRVGTCGGIADDIKVRDVAIGASAHTDNGVAIHTLPGVALSLAASTDMLLGAVTKARELTSQTDVNVLTGALYSSDIFYSDAPQITEGLRKLGCLGVEMEAAGLYTCALREHREALAVCTVSDHLFNHASDMTPEQRQSDFETALRISLAALLA
ncbi:MAG: purine-nucleoside phosphorylase [Propionibacteriaceae bacterium]|jgi:purine-nucleoside phosphorylase|nr:purine-nucleoside phosphorylase [Propionibacteriaceae bacterium]